MNPRDFAWKLAPGVMANRARRYEVGFRSQHGVTAEAEQLIARQGAIVTGGPFQGMRYPAERIADVDTPVGKLTGVYEAEIYAPFEQALLNSVSTFIDIGCADGYYAVGMAVASPTLTSYAFDLASSARKLCEHVARLKG